MVVGDGRSNDFNFTARDVVVENEEEEVDKDEKEEDERIRELNDKGMLELSHKDTLGSLSQSFRSILHADGSHVSNTAAPPVSPELTDDVIFVVAVDRSGVMGERDNDSLDLKGRLPRDLRNVSIARLPADEHVFVFDSV